METKPMSHAFRVTGATEHAIAVVVDLLQNIPGEIDFHEKSCIVRIITENDTDAEKIMEILENNHFIFQIFEES